MFRHIYCGDILSHSFLFSERIKLCYTLLTIEKKSTRSGNWWAVMFDLSKMLDSLPHGLAIVEIYVYGINVYGKKLSVVSWLLFIYITRNKDSNSKGLISGLLLFIIYVNDLYTLIAIGTSVLVRTWWRHQMETISALLALCEGNPMVTDGFPSKRPLERNFDVFFDLRLNKRLS